MKLAIVGSRSLHRKSYIYSAVKLAQRHVRNEENGLDLNPEIEEIVSGGAQGVDRMAEAYAEKHGIPTKIFPADWKRHGRKAGFLRNREIVKHADIVAAVWDGKSKGTKITMDLANRLDVPLVVVEVAGA